jgi:hypothetical protein
LVFAACLPGAVVLVVAAVRRRAMITQVPPAVPDHRELVTTGSAAGG